MSEHRSLPFYRAAFRERTQDIAIFAGNVSYVLVGALTCAPSPYPPTTSSRFDLQAAKLVSVSCHTGQVST